MSDICKKVPYVIYTDFECLLEPSEEKKTEQTIDII